MDSHKAKEIVNAIASKVEDSFGLGRAWGNLTIPEQEKMKGDWYDILMKG